MSGDAIECGLRRLPITQEPPPAHDQWAAFLEWVRATLRSAGEGRTLLERFIRLSPEGQHAALDQPTPNRESLLNSEKARLAAVISSFGDGIVIFDGCGRATSANVHARRLLQEPTADLAGVPVQDVLTIGSHGEGRPLTPGSRPVREENVQVTSRAGTRFTASYTLAPIDGEGWILGLSDVSDTERERAELGRQVEYTSALLASMQDGLTVYGPDGRMIEANPRFCEMTQFTREELIGAGAPLPFLPGVPMERVDRTFRRVREAGALEMEHEYTRKDGSLMPVLVAMSTFRTGTDEIGGYVATVKDITDRRRIEAELLTRATTDGLTELANHRAFHERMADEVERARDRNLPLSVMLIDIDHFKRINDVYGHAAGDAVLVEVAARLRGISGERGFIARVGGEEFGWLLRDTTGGEAAGAAERLRSAIEGTPFDVVGRVAVSVGVCGVETRSTEEFLETCSANHLLQAADLALYWSKGHGRNRVSLYDARLRAAADAEDVRTRIERAERLGAIQALARAVDARDPATHHHSTRVAELAARLAEALGWGSDDVARLHDAGLVHDVGKLGVPDAILLKPGALDRLEYEQIKGHAATGAQMVTGTLDDDQVAWIRGHHERFDGRGYPDGLAGSRIPPGARILAVADAWDAITFPRVYSRSRSGSEALAECRREAGRQFCPEVVRALERVHASEGLDLPDAMASLDLPGTGASVPASRRLVPAS